MHELSQCSGVASCSAEATPASPQPASSASSASPNEAAPEASPPQASDAALALPRVQRRRGLWVLHGTALSPFR